MTDELAEVGYGLDWIPITNLLWGQGILTPGGLGNIARIVRHDNLEGRRVLDFGSGVGGASIVLACDYGARVVGFEIEEDYVGFSRELAREQGFSDKVEFHHFTPGPLPVDDASFDFFFTSGVICHVEDKRGVFEEAFRILRPGGKIIGYDWFVEKSHPDIDAWTDTAGFQIYNSRPEDHLDSLKSAGFKRATCDDSTDWYKRRAREELQRLKGPLFDETARLTSTKIRDQFIDEWQCMNNALATGFVKQGYFRACKPD